MANDFMSDWETWIHDMGGDRLFRFWIYKRNFTPYEWDKKFSDESLYENTEPINAFIKESIELPKGEILLGLHEIWDETDLNNDNPNITYHLLNDVKMEFHPKDIKDWIDDFPTDDENREDD